jgi:hypothetical protein
MRDFHGEEEEYYRYQTFDSRGSIYILMSIFMQGLDEESLEKCCIIHCKIPDTINMQNKNKMLEMVE